VPRAHDDNWDLASSVGMTATMVAAGRAMASNDPRGLIDDPFAEPLVRAVGVDFFTKMMHVPAPLAFLAIAAEFFGGIGLILGLLTRVAAFGIGMNMLVAIATVHHNFGFFMNWTGSQKGEGFEFHLLVLAIVAFLMIKGAGAFSLDRAFTVSASSGAAGARLAHS